MNEQQPDDIAETIDPGPDGTERDDNALTDDASRPKEIGGRKGLDPTRYGDWEKNGRCIDF